MNPKRLFILKNSGGGGRLKIELTNWRDVNSYAKNQESWYGKFSREPGHRRGTTLEFLEDLSGLLADEGSK